MVFFLAHRMYQKLVISSFPRFMLDFNAVGAESGSIGRFVYAGRVRHWCCPLASHLEHTTWLQTTDRSMLYAFRYDTTSAIILKRDVFDSLAAPCRPAGL